MEAQRPINTNTSSTANVPTINPVQTSLPKNVNGAKLDINGSKPAELPGKGDVVDKTKSTQIKVSNPEQDTKNESNTIKTNVKGSTKGNTMGDNSINSVEKPNENIKVDIKQDKPVSKVDTSAPVIESNATQSFQQTNTKSSTALRRKDDPEMDVMANYYKSYRHFCQHPSSMFSRGLRGYFELNGADLIIYEARIAESDRLPNSKSRVVGDPIKATVNLFDAIIQMTEELKKPVPIKSILRSGGSCNEGKFGKPSAAPKGAEIEGGKQDGSKLYICRDVPAKYKVIVIPRSASGFDKPLECYFESKSEAEFFEGAFLAARLIKHVELYPLLKKIMKKISNRRPTRILQELKHETVARVQRTSAMRSFMNSMLNLPMNRALAKWKSAAEFRKQQAEIYMRHITSQLQMKDSVGDSRGLVDDTNELRRVAYNKIQDVFRSALQKRNLKWAEETLMRGGSEEAALAARKAVFKHGTISKLRRGRTGEEFACLYQVHEAIYRYQKVRTSTDAINDIGNEKQNADYSTKSIPLQNGLLKVSGDLSKLLFLPDQERNPEESSLEGVAGNFSHVGIETVSSIIVNAPRPHDLEGIESTHTMTNTLFSPSAYQKEIERSVMSSGASHTISINASNGEVGSRKQIIKLAKKIGMMFPALTDSLAVGELRRYLRPVDVRSGSWLTVCGPKIGLPSMTGADILEEREMAVFARDEPLLWAQLRMDVGRVALNLPRLFPSIAEKTKNTFRGTVNPTTGMMEQVPIRLYVTVSCFFQRFKSSSVDVANYIGGQGAHIALTCEIEIPFGPAVKGDEHRNDQLFAADRKRFFSRSDCVAVIDVFAEEGIVSERGPILFHSSPDYEIRNATFNNESKYETMLERLRLLAPPRIISSGKVGLQNFAHSDVLGDNAFPLFTLDCDGDSEGLSSGDIATGLGEIGSFTCRCNVGRFVAAPSTRPISPSLIGLTPLNSLTDYVAGIDDVMTIAEAERSNEEGKYSKDAIHRHQEELRKSRIQAAIKDRQQKDAGNSLFGEFSSPNRQNNGKNKEFDENDNEKNLLTSVNRSVRETADKILSPVNKRINTTLDSVLQGISDTVDQVENATSNLGSHFVDAVDNFVSPNRMKSGEEYIDRVALKEKGILNTVVGGRSPNGGIVFNEQYLSEGVLKATTLERRLGSVVVVDVSSIDVDDNCPVAASDPGFIAATKGQTSINGYHYFVELIVGDVVASSVPCSFSLAKESEQKNATHVNRRLRARLEFDTSVMANAFDHNAFTEVQWATLLLKKVHSPNIEAIDGHVSTPLVNQHIELIGELSIPLWRLEPDRAHGTPVAQLLSDSEINLDELDDEEELDNNCPRAYRLFKPMTSRKFGAKSLDHANIVASARAKAENDRVKALRARARALSGNARPGAANLLSAVDVRESIEDIFIRNLNEENKISMDSMIPGVEMKLNISLHSREHARLLQLIDTDSKILCVGDKVLVDLVQPLSYPSSPEDFRRLGIWEMYSPPAQGIASHLPLRPVCDKIEFENSGYTGDYIEEIEVDISSSQNDKSKIMNKTKSTILIKRPRSTPLRTGCVDPVPCKFILPQTEMEFRRRNLPGVYREILKSGFKPGDEVSFLTHKVCKVPATILAVFKNHTATVQLECKQSELPVGTIFPRGCDYVDAYRIVQGVPLASLVPAHLTSINIYNASLKLNSIDRENLIGGILPADANPAYAEYEWLLHVRAPNQQLMADWALTIRAIAQEYAFIRKKRFEYALQEDGVLAAKFKVQRSSDKAKKQQMLKQRQQLLEADALQNQLAAKRKREAEAIKRVPLLEAGRLQTVLVQSRIYALKSNQSIISKVASSIPGVGENSMSAYATFQYMSVPKSGGIHKIYSMALQRGHPEVADQILNATRFVCEQRMTEFNSNRFWENMGVASDLLRTAQPSEKSLVEIVQTAIYMVDFKAAFGTLLADRVVSRFARELRRMKLSALVESPVLADISPSSLISVDGCSSLEHAALQGSLDFDVGIIDRIAEVASLNAATEADRSRLKVRKEYIALENELLKTSQMLGESRSISISGTEEAYLYDLDWRELQLLSKYAEERLSSPRRKDLVKVAHPASGFTFSTNTLGTADEVPMVVVKVFEKGFLGSDALIGFVTLNPEEISDICAGKKSIDHETGLPNPDEHVRLLWKRLIPHRRYKITHTISEGIVHSDSIESVVAGDSQEPWYSKSKEKALSQIRGNSTAAPVSIPASSDGVSPTLTDHAIKQQQLSNSSEDEKRLKELKLTLNQPDQVKTTTAHCANRSHVFQVLSTIQIAKSAVGHNSAFNTMREVASVMPLNTPEVLVEEKFFNPKTNELSIQRITVEAFEDSHYSGDICLMVRFVPKVNAEAVTSTLSEAANALPSATPAMLSPNPRANFDNEMGAINSPNVKIENPSPSVASPSRAAAATSIGGAIVPSFKSSAVEWRKFEINVCRQSRDSAGARLLLGPHHPFLPSGGILVPQNIDQLSPSRHLSGKLEDPSTMPLQWVSLPEAHTCAAAYDLATRFQRFGMLLSDERAFAFWERFFMSERVLGTDANPMLKEKLRQQWIVLRHLFAYRSYYKRDVTWALQLERALTSDSNFSDLISSLNPDVIMSKYIRDNATNFNSQFVHPIFLVEVWGRDNEGDMGFIPGYERKKPNTVFLGETYLDPVPDIAEQLARPIQLKNYSTFAHQFQSKYKGGVDIRGRNIVFKHSNGLWWVCEKNSGNLITPLTRDQFSSHTQTDSTLLLKDSASKADRGFAQTLSVSHLSHLQPWYIHLNASYRYDPENSNANVALTVKELRKVFIPKLVRGPRRFDSHEIQKMKEDLQRKLNSGVPVDEVELSNLQFSHGAADLTEAQKVDYDVKFSRRIQPFIKIYKLNINYNDVHNSIWEETPFVTSTDGIFIPPEVPLPANWVEIDEIAEAPTVMRKKAADEDEPLIDIEGAFRISKKTTTTPNSPSNNQKNSKLPIESPSPNAVELEKVVAMKGPLKHFEGETVFSACFTWNYEAAPLHGERHVLRIPIVTEGQMDERMVKFQLGDPALSLGSIRVLSCDFWRLLRSGVPAEMRAYVWSQLSGGYLVQSVLKDRFEAFKGMKKFSSSLLGHNFFDHLIKLSKNVETAALAQIRDDVRDVAWNLDPSVLNIIQEDYPKSFNDRGVQSSSVTHPDILPLWESVRNILSALFMFCRKTNQYDSAENSFTVHSIRSIFDDFMHEHWSSIRMCRSLVFIVFYLKLNHGGFTLSDEQVFTMVYALTAASCAGGELANASKAPFADYFSEPLLNTTRSSRLHTTPFLYKSVKPIEKRMNAHRNDIAQAVPPPVKNGSVYEASSSQNNSQNGGFPVIIEESRAPLIPTLPGAVVDCILLESSLWLLNSDTAAWLKEVGFSLTAIFYPLFMQLFAGSLPSQSLFRLWDLVMYNVSVQFTSPSAYSADSNMNRFVHEADPLHASHFIRIMAESFFEELERKTYAELGLLGPEMQKKAELDKLNSDALRDPDVIDARNDSRHIMENISRGRKVLIAFAYGVVMEAFGDARVTRRDAISTPAEAKVRLDQVLNRLHDPDQLIRIFDRGVHDIFSSDSAVRHIILLSMNQIQNRILELRPHYYQNSVLQQIVSPFASAMTGVPAASPAVLHLKMKKPDQMVSSQFNKGNSSSSSSLINAINLPRIVDPLTGKEISDGSVYINKREKLVIDLTSNKNKGSTNVVLPFGGLETANKRQEQILKTRRVTRGVVMANNEVLPPPFHPVTGESLDPEFVLVPSSNNTSIHDSLISAANEIDFDFIHGRDAGLSTFDLATLVYPLMRDAVMTGGQMGLCAERPIDESIFDSSHIESTQHVGEDDSTLRAKFYNSVDESNKCYRRKRMALLPPGAVASMLLHIDALSVKRNPTGGQGAWLSHVHIHYSFGGDFRFAASILFASSGVKTANGTEMATAVDKKSTIAIPIFSRTSPIVLRFVFDHKANLSVDPIEVVVFNPQRAVQFKHIKSNRTALAQIQGITQPAVLDDILESNEIADKSAIVTDSFARQKVMRVGQSMLSEIISSSLPDNELQNLSEIEYPAQLEKRKKEALVKTILKPSKLLKAAHAQGVQQWDDNQNIGIFFTFSIIFDAPADSMPERIPHEDIQALKLILERESAMAIKSAKPSIPTPAGTAVKDANGVIQAFKDSNPSQPPPSTETNLTQFDFTNLILDYNLPIHYVPYNPSFFLGCGDWGTRTSSRSVNAAWDTNLAKARLRWDLSWKARQYRMIVEKLRSMFDFNLGHINFDKFKLWVTGLYDRDRKWLLDWINSCDMRSTSDKIRDSLSCDPCYGGSGNNGSRDGTCSPDNIFGFASCLSKPSVPQGPSHKRYVDLFIDSEKDLLKPAAMEPLKPKAIAVSMPPKIEPREKSLAEHEISKKYEHEQIIQDFFKGDDDKWNFQQPASRKPLTIVYFPRRQWKYDPEYASQHGGVTRAQFHRFIANIIPAWIPFVDRIMESFCGLPDVFRVLKGPVRRRFGRESFALCTPPLVSLREFVASLIAVSRGTVAEKALLLFDLFGSFEPDMPPVKGFGRLPTKGWNEGLLGSSRSGYGSESESRSGDVAAVLSTLPASVGGCSSSSPLPDGLVESKVNCITLPDVAAMINILANRTLIGISQAEAAAIAAAAFDHFAVGVSHVESAVLMSEYYMRNDEAAARMSGTSEEERHRMDVTECFNSAFVSRQLLDSNSSVVDFSAVSSFKDIFGLNDPMPNTFKVLQIILDRPDLVPIHERRRDIHGRLEKDSLRKKIIFVRFDAHGRIVAGNGGDAYIDDVGNMLVDSDGSALIADPTALAARASFLIHPEHVTIDIRTFVNRFVSFSLISEPLRQLTASDSLYTFSSKYGVGANNSTSEAITEAVTVAPQSFNKSILFEFANCMSIQDIFKRMSSNLSPHDNLGRENLVNRLKETLSPILFKSLRDTDFDSTRKAIPTANSAKQQLGANDPTSRGRAANSSPVTEGVSIHNLPAEDNDLRTTNLGPKISPSRNQLPIPEVTAVTNVIYPLKLGRYLSDASGWPLHQLLTVNETDALLGPSFAPSNEEEVFVNPRQRVRKDKIRALMSGSTVENKGAGSKSVSFSPSRNLRENNRDEITYRDAV